MSLFTIDEYVGKKRLTPISLIRQARWILSQAAILTAERWGEVLLRSTNCSCFLFLFLCWNRNVNSKTIFWFVLSLFSLGLGFLKLTKEQLGSGICLCTVMHLFHTRVDWQNGLWTYFLSAIECTPIIPALSSLQASVVLKDAQTLSM